MLRKEARPRLIHIRTTKGKGLAQAEEQVLFHAPGKFDPQQVNLT